MLLNKYLLTISLILIWNQNVISQIKKANNWHFRYNNGIVFGDSLINKKSFINDDESSSSISDVNGNLLFYTNGNDIYNKFENVIKNGRNLGFVLSNNTTSSSCGSILVSHVDNNDSIVYLFNTDNLGKIGGLVYSKIMTFSNNDSGEVVARKQKLIGPVIESISAVNHSNGRDIWLICHGVGNNLFYSFLITKDGISNCPVISSIGINLCSFSSSCSQVPMKFSPDGNFVALERFGSTINSIEIFEFNCIEGKVFNNLKKISTYFYTFEFSPDSKSIFIRDINKVTMINLYNNLTKSSNNSIFYNITGMQICNNGNLLMLNYNSKDLIIIKNSNDTNFDYNYKLKSNFFNFNAINFPTFNQSYFYTPAINYSYEMNCTKNSVQFWGKDTFGANSHTWEARKLAGGSWQLAGSTKDVNYSFSDTGVYEVRYIAALTGSASNRADTVIKSITIYDKINNGFLGKDTVFSEGDVISKTLFAPLPNHCVKWYFDRLSNQSDNGNSFVADSVGTYICKVTNAAFCEVWDTITISTCINNLNQPSLFRSRDTLKTWHLNADSFVWFRNNQLYKITKQPFLKLTDTGTYRVEAAKKGHCNRGSVSQLMVNKLSVRGITIDDLGIKVFPNPSNGIVRIESDKDFKLEVVDLLGRVINPNVILENFVPEIYSESIQLPKGIYFFVFSVDGNRVTEKVVVW